MNVRRFILGTDWWTDCDDAVALRVLSRRVKEKKAELAGTVINACMEYSAASVRGFLTAEGLENIPIGMDTEATDFGGTPRYQKRLAEIFCPDGSDFEDGVRLYRRLLSCYDGKTEIIEIGYLQVLAALLKSGPDDISPKTGEELVLEKVSKLWVMGGKWDKDGEKENNFCRNPRARKAAAEVVDLCPVPVTFLGFEVGCDVISGGELDEDDFLHKVLVDHGSAKGRSSWDPMLVCMALNGDEEASGYDTVRGTASVDPETGANYFRKDPDGKHKYVVKKYPDSYYADIINGLLK